MYIKETLKNTAEMAWEHTFGLLKINMVITIYSFVSTLPEWTSIFCLLLLLLFVSVEIIVGFFKNNAKNGHGTFYFHNGDRFEGEYYNGKRNGHGIYVWVGFFS